MGAAFFFHFFAQAERERGVGGGATYAYISYCVLSPCRDKNVSVIDQASIENKTLPNKCPREHVGKEDL